LWQVFSFGTQRPVARLFATHIARGQAMPMLWFLPMIMLSAMFDVTSRAAVVRAEQVRDLTGGLLS
jgi:hypothetical protein